jgi:hypothetical protein
MLAAGLKFFSDTPVSVFGMILFLIAFFAVTAWTFLRLDSRDYYQDIAKLPLTENGEES